MLVPQNWGNVAQFWIHCQSKCLIAHGEPVAETRLTNDRFKQITGTIDFNAYVNYVNKVE
jgi:hypothetical protein